MTGMYFDDLAVGQMFETDPVVLTEQAIIAFARQWDPQPFHLDPEVAAQSQFGGLIASGFHTMLATFAECVKLPPFVTASMGSPGMAEVRWIRPVRPGDALSTVLEVVALKPSVTRPDRGYATLDHRVSAATGEVVMTYRSTVIFATRPG